MSTSTPPTPTRPVEPLRTHRTLAWLVVGDVAALVAVGVVRARSFRDYSNRFGSLSEAEFTAFNSQFDALRWVAQLLLLSLMVLDAALLVASVRALGQAPRAGLYLALALAMGAFIAFALLLAGLPGGGMIG